MATEVEARAQLEIMVVAASEPTLTSDEIDFLITKARLADAYGRTPSNEDWEPTYDLNRAAMEGWRLKASKVAGWYSFSDSGASYNRQQVYEHCLAMSKEYSKKIMSSVNVPGRTASGYGELTNAD